MSSVIRIENLEWAVRDGDQWKKVLSISELEINAGEFVHLTGKTGAGKSSLVALMSGLQRIDQGEIYLFSQAISKLPDLLSAQLRANKLGIVFQHFFLLEKLSVRANLELALMAISNAQEGLIAQALSFVGLAHKSEQQVAALSGGEKQKCALARAILADPPLLLLDEPSAHLDQASTLELATLLNNLHQQGKTLVIITHDSLLSNALNINRSLELRGGVIYE